MFLSRTIQDILEHSEAKTEVVVTLDGAWSEPQIPDDNRVKIIYHAESVGQRAATNDAAKLADGKYVMKCDAHCSFDQGFDRKMLEAFKVAGDNVTMVPIMRNHHAFDWVCPDGHRRYQGPSGPCKEAGCNKPTTRDVVWIGKPNPQSTSYCFDSEPHFQYFKEYAKRPVYQESLKNTGLTETMSLQGSCFMMTRKQYFDLNICDESFGSWGSQGIEVAVKTWLSGGKVMVNHNTWYSHMFRTQGLDFGFPYPISGRQVSSAKKKAGELFFDNKWSQQIYPLSWLLERFWPVRGWTEEQLLVAKEKGATFTNLRSEKLRVLGVIPSVPGTKADPAASVSPSSGGQEMSISTQDLPSLSGGNSVTVKDVGLVGNKSEMSGVTTGPIITNMIKDGDGFALPVGDGTNKPSVHKSMDFIKPFVNPNLSVSPVNVSGPIPAPGGAFNPNLAKDAADRFGGDPVDNKHVEDVHNTSVSQVKDTSSYEVEPTDDRGIVYYTDNQLKLKIAHAVQDNLKSTGLPIISASLKPMTHFGQNIHLKLERGYLAMFKQILAGLEASTADYVFLCEHDVLYSPSHFDFTPPTRDKFYYNVNWWRIRLSDGFAVSWEANQVSGLCADRKLLLEHYRKRVAIVEKYGYGSGMGFEPGSHNDPKQHGYRERGSIPPEAYIDDIMAESWKSIEPNVDLKHGKNLSKNKWSLNDFRDKKTAVNFRTGACPVWAQAIVRKIGPV